MYRASKIDLLSALQTNDYDSIVAKALRDRAVVNHLIRFAYDKETLVGWRAIVAMGRVARELVKSDHEFLRNTCRKLLWSLNDESGGIGWAAPELLGEIVSADPLRFSDMIPIIAGIYEFEEDVFRSGVLYALYCNAETAPELVAPYREIMMKALADRSPMVKVRGIALIGRIWSWIRKHELWSEEYLKIIMTVLEKNRTDKSEVWVYEIDRFTAHEVGDDMTTLLKTIY